jgi:hypothetical protein
MRKWGEIKQATLDKMGLTPDEITSDSLDKFQYYANEALDLIANGVKPRIVAYHFQVFDKIVYGSDFVYDAERKVVTYTPADLHNGERKQLDVDKTTVYYQDEDTKYTMTNGVWLLNKAAYHLNDRVTMPEDFLSFADMTNYHNNKPWFDIVYLGDRDFVVGETGVYVVYYNALWEHVVLPSDGQDEYQLTADLSVIRCLPTYMAAKSLAQDDIQRATSLNNEFELMLSRLDTNIMYQNNSFRSSGGWY